MTCDVLREPIRALPERIGVTRPRRGRALMPAGHRWLTWLAAGLAGLASLMRAEPAVRGLPFTRSYPLEEIGNVPRGAKLSFDRFGRLAVVHDGFYTVLNDTVWLELEDASNSDVTMANVVQAKGGVAYYGGGGSWGTAELDAQGKLRPHPFPAPGAPRWVATTNFNDVVVTERGVYFGGWNGVVFWDFATRQNRFFAMERMSRLFRLGERVYAGCFGAPLYRIDGPAGVQHTVPGTDFGETPVDQATSLDQNRTLIATRDGRMLVFDGSDFTPWRGQARAHPEGRVSSLRHLVDGGIAVAVTGKGLFLYSVEGDLVTSLTSSEYQRIMDVASREPGVLWAVGENGVEKVFYGSPLTVFGQRLGLALSWPTVVRWQDKIIIASSGRLFEAVPGAVGAASRFTPLKDQPVDGAWALTSSGKHLLAGNARGAFALGEDGRFSQIVAGLDVDRLAMFGPDLCFVIGRLQVAVVRWSEGRWTECAPRIAAVGYAPVVHSGKKAVWLELGANQVVRLSLKDGRLRQRLFNEFPWKDIHWVNVGILGDTVILTGPVGCRVFFDENSETFRAAPELQRLLEQSPAWILRIKQDESGTLWATHEQGVATFVPQAGGYRIDTTSFDLNNEHFPLVQLLPGDDVWFATSQSLYHVERRDVADFRRSLRPMLVSVTDGRTNAELFPARTATTNPLRLSYAQNDLSFRFFAGSYAWRRAPVYEFKFADGANWRTLGTGSLLSFPGLREGAYHLAVRIADRGGSTAPVVSFDFEIRPPWHRTPAAYFLGGLGGVLAIAGLVRWSVHRAHRRNLDLEKLIRERTDQLTTAMEKLNEETRNAATLAERDRLAGEIHDSLQQGLSGLMLQIDATLKLPALSGEVRSRLNVARNMVSFTRHEVQHAVWDLESPLLEDTELGEALRKLTALINPGTARIDLAVEGSPSLLAPAMKHHLLRIAQEAITNAVRHAAPRTITIRLEYRPDAVTLVIADDGIGFRPDDVLANGVGHFGLRGLRGRAAKIGGALAVDSAPGRGATIKVTAPLTLPTPNSNHGDAL